jgi:TonB-dependent starch-binding outer membrane protein SusC
MHCLPHRKKPGFKLKRLALLLLFPILALAASAQGITLQLKNASLEIAFREIEKQIPQHFVYTTEMLQQTTPVTIKLKNSSLDDALQQLLKDQPLQYTLDENFIKIRFKQAPAPPPTIDLRGTVTNEAGEPLPNVSVQALQTGNLTITDPDGAFTLTRLKTNETLLFTCIGYTSLKIDLQGRTNIKVQLSISVSELDKAVVIAYGTTTQRLSTSNIGKMAATDISRQPSANPLSLIQGRVPGVLITQSNGVPGSAVKIEIRGRNSIAQGSDPLFIIDGVPFAPGNSLLNQISSALGVTSSTASFSSGLSPFSLINPSDIESIEILKDADATAIYGSRGANGVVLITTKKAKSGKTGFLLNLNTGWSRVARSVNMLTTPAYLQMRREAFANDHLTLTTDPSNPGYAPDLLLWDTTRYTNFTKMLIGGTARSSQLQASLSGGSPNTRFLLAGNYRYQSTVFPGSFNDEQGTAHVNLDHTTTNKKLNAAFSLVYTSDRNNLLSTDLTSYINLPPNLPPLFDSVGNLKWEQAGVNYPSGNPFSQLIRTYLAQSENLISNLRLSYQLLSHLTLRANLGYNTVQVDETALSPSLSFNPQLNAKGSSTFAHSFTRSYILEPQLEYRQSFSKHNLGFLLGSTFQDISATSNADAGLDYTNDLALRSLAAAGRVVVSNTSAQYRYEAAFGRLNYDYNKKYILNLSGRRDGSSRFGTGRQWAGFGAAGAAWIFTQEKFLEKLKGFLSYGKLRGSYGSSGNDQIGNYQYLDSWVSTPNPYQGIPGFAPARLFNPDYSWEANKKLEAALELAFMHDRLFISSSWFRNRSSNQLVAYPLPGQTGFSSINKNLPALVQNRGWEWLLNYRSNYTSQTRWESSFNLSSYRNELLAFPALSSSSYSRTYVVGQPLSVLQGYHFLGVDTQSGIYAFQDLDKDGKLSYPYDFAVLGNLDPKFYGGFTNTVYYKNFELSVLFEFRKQKGHNYLQTSVTRAPGSMNNQPDFVLDRWQKPGDLASVQQFYVNTGSAPAKTVTNFLQSDGWLGDASYIRGKNLSLAYDLSKNSLQKLNIDAARFYVQAVNFCTITKYKGADPETQNFYALPPLRQVVVGATLNF